MNILKAMIKPGAVNFVFRKSYPSAIRRLIQIKLTQAMQALNQI